ncbi:MAG: PIG-L deacetylase family protein [Acidimicrobiia bacterium]
MSTDLPAPRRALAVGAHPDDVEFGCGATLAKWAAAGTDVRLLVLTDGSKGSWDAEADLAALVARRRDEQKAAATALGAAGVTFLDAVDGELDSGLARRAEVCAVIRHERPDVVLGHDPWKRYRIHPDHRHAGFLVIDAIVAARDPHFFPEQGVPRHRPRHLLLFEPDEVDHLERVGDHLDAKVEALLCHRSQWRSTLEIETDDPADRVRFAERIREEAGEAGGNEGAAEPFKLLDDL